MKDPTEVATVLQITPASVAARLAAVDLDGAGRAGLRQAAPMMQSSVEAFLDRLYARLRDHADTAALLTSDEQIVRLKAQQRRYLEELFTADIDWPYVLRRLWIGVVHHRVALTPQWFLTTYAHVICEYVDQFFVPGSDRRTARDRTVTLIKSVFFDATLALAAYGRSREAELWSQTQIPSVSPHASPTGGEAQTTRRVPASAAASYVRIRLTGEDTDARRTFIGLTHADLASLRAMRPLIETHSPAILDDFYRFLSSVPETAALVPPDVADRLKHQVAAYWLELVDGAFDRPYAASRMRIGVMHEKIGLSAEWYLVGLVRQLVGFLSAIDPEQPGAAAGMQALVRAVFFDLSFVIDAYMDARADTLLRTEGYANQLVAGLAAAVAVVDARDRLISANRTLVSMVGGDAAVLYLMPIERALPLPETGELVRRLRNGLRQGHDGHLVAAGRLGARRLRLTVMALADTDGADGAIALVVDDITDLVRISADLDHYGDQFEQLADHVGFVLWELDTATWTITAINKSVVTLTGLRDVSFLGRPSAWLDRVVPEDRARFVDRLSTLKPGDRGQIEYRLTHADGREVWVRSHVSASGSAASRVTAATLDITAMRRSEALRLEAVATIAGGVAHVVNNCLTGVVGGIEMHAKETGGLDRAPMLRSALESTGRAARTAAQLLAFAGEQTLRPTLVSLTDVVKAGRPALQALVGSSILVQVDLHEDAWPCRVDRVMLLRSLECLADNARDAMGWTGELRVSTRNQPGAQLPPDDEGNGQDWVEVTVADNGPGMTDRVRAHAVEPFFTTRSLAEATGLGLSMVHGFVTQSGGRMRIDSRPGHGTAVTLRFPRVDTGAIAPHESTSPLVLLIDDQAEIRAVTAVMVRALGYRVAETGSAREAVRLAQQLEPQILLTDVILGQSTDGIALAIQLWMANPRLSVILISGYAASRFSLDALPRGSQFLPKPFTLADLGACLERARIAQG